jgi:hypothetical protein
MLWKTLLVAIILQFPNTSFGAEIFSYKLRNYPVALEKCEATSKALAEKLSTATGVKIYNTSCKKDWAGTAIEIQYVADDSLLLVSTDMRAITVNEQVGSYKTYAECTADQKAQQGLFAAATGLTPVISYCYSDSSLTEAPFVSRIDAFGDTAVFPFQYVGRISGVPAEDVSGLKQQIQKKVEAEGFRVAKVVIAAEDRMNKTDHNLGILYYGKRPRNWQNFSGYFSFGSTAICAAEKAYLSKALTTVKAEPLAFFCSWDPMLFTAHFEAFAHSQSPWIKSEKGPKTYSKYAECAADREPMISFYKTTLGKDPVSAICEQTRSYPSTYRLQLLFACESAGNWDCHLDPIEGLGFPDRNSERENDRRE